MKNENKKFDVKPFDNNVLIKAREKYLKKLMGEIKNVKKYKNITKANCN